MTTFTKVLVEDGSVTIHYLAGQNDKTLEYARKLMISISGDKINIHASCIGHKILSVEGKYANGVDLVIKEPDASIDRK